MVGMGSESFEGQPTTTNYGIFIMKTVESIGLKHLTVYKVITTMVIGPFDDHTLFLIYFHLFGAFVKAV